MKTLMPDMPKSPSWEPTDRNAGYKWIDETTECWWTGNQWSETFRHHPRIPVEVVEIEARADGIYAVVSLPPFDELPKINRINSLSIFVQKEDH